MIDASQIRFADTLKDGTSVTIRAVHPDDKTLIQTAFHNLEPHTIYRRFFTFKSELTKEELKDITEVDFNKDMTLLVTIGSDESEVVIGMGRYALLPHEPYVPVQAEVAFTVEEDFQNLGIASRLLIKMAEIAREVNVEEFVATMLPQNKAMLAVFKRSGFRMKQTREDGVISITLAIK